MEPLFEENFEENDSSKAYQELWNFNLQKIEEIQQDIEKSIAQMEQERRDFDMLYTGIAKKMDMLSSIYFSNIAIGGLEYVTRLNSVLRTYRHRSSGEGPNFNLIHNLLAKITEARNRAFEQFPEMSDLEYAASARAEASSSKHGIQKRFKWVTFKRNRSWFIAPFNTLEIRPNENYQIESFEKPDFILIDLDNSAVRIEDIFSKFSDRWRKPACFLLLNERKKNFAADRIGRQVFANRDMLKPMLRPFGATGHHRLSPGRVRLFGINHILLY